MIHLNTPYKENTLQWSTNWLKVKEWKRYTCLQQFHTNCIQKILGMITKISNKTDVNTDSLPEEKYTHFIRKKGKIYWQRYFKYIYASIIRATKYIQQYLTELNGKKQ